MGNIPAVKVHAANEHDGKSGRSVFPEALCRYPTLPGVCADAGYRGIFVTFVVVFLGLVCDISERIKPLFEILPKRWRAERTFAWLGNSRRLSKDYEKKICSSECMIIISHLHTLLKRL